jgi:L-lactate dehydrogenase complex protein LldE
VKIDKLDVSFPYRVGLHNSCHGHRALGLGSPSELNIQSNNKLKNLLNLVQDIDVVELSRDDECCGFGGTFCVTEEDISVAMGKDRVDDHINAKAEVITGADMSCLMHMQGIIKRDKKALKVMHITEILAGEF